MTTRCHSRSLVVSCCHSLLLVVPLVVTSCHSSCYHSLSLDVSVICPVINDSSKTSNDQKKTFACPLQSNALTKLKIFQEKYGPLLQLIYPVTLLKRDSIKEILLLNVPTFFWGGGGGYFAK